MSLAELVQSSGWKNLIAKLYGFGASIVIIGALFKIQHWPMAGTMLTVGLCTESIIFFFSAFEPLHEEVDWSLVYPELAGITEEGEEQLPASGKYRDPYFQRLGAAAGGGAGSVALAKFDEMLEKSEITPEIFQNLGAGLKKISEATANMNAMVDVSSASEKYLETIKLADESLSKLNESYQATTKIINETGLNYKSISDTLSIIEMGGKSYQEQIDALNKNLSALNAAYELQLKGANNYVKESESLYKELQSLVEDLAHSASDTKKYREQIAKLNENLSELNNVYGNMLAAIK
ncbi:MAG TPA: gliding motility protein GldL [Bacteroidales bacterium]|nr:gliding motility protein GldL [Bacteroidales bacterium]HQG35980.1 gliding motility protein GldL [Bacteroidales bacterium]HQJ20819.1 gliding motility protein GldL [Bacteroidales bacterium]